LTLHTNVEPDSLLVKVNVADALLLAAGGAVPIAVCGESVSTLHA
jgi:hypothetical protein